MSVPLAAVREASTVLCIGLDTRFGGSVVGVAIRQAIKHGARIVTIHPRDHNLARIAHKWLHPNPGRELDLLNSLVHLTGKQPAAAPPPGLEAEFGGITNDLTELADMFRDSSSNVILVGSEYLTYRESSQILGTIAQLAQSTGSGLFPVPAQGNLLGSVLTGVYPELLPGAFPWNDESKLNDLRRIWGVGLSDSPLDWTAESLLDGQRMKALYLIGEVPFKHDPPADFLIFQNIYPPPEAYRADLVLPSAAFSEVDGTLFNVEGRIQRVRKAVNAPGEALPDWDILCRIARKMGFKGFDFRSAMDIHQEISLLNEGFTNFQSPDRVSRPLKYDGRMMASQNVAPVSQVVDKEFPFILTSSIPEHTYRGFPISARVEGAKVLFAEAAVEISPDDAEQAGISQGNEVLVISRTFETILRANILSGQEKGRLHISPGHGEYIGAGPHPARIVKSHV